MQSSSVHTFSPTVLIVDDDPAVLDILARRFHQKTSLGVIKLQNLADAYKLFVEDTQPSDALLSDLYFVPETHDEANELLDGLDLIKLSQDRFPQMPKYVCSVYDQEKTYRKHADEMELVINQWFSKLNMDLQEDGVVSPWNKIERDLYRNALVDNTALLAQAEAAGFNRSALDDEAVLDWIRNSIRPRRKTYLQTLGPRNSEYEIIKPISVICEELADGQVSVEAPALGLILPCFGDNVDDALVNLSHMIVEQYQEFSSVDRSQIVGYAEKVFNRLEEYVSFNERQVAQL